MILRSAVLVKHPVYQRQKNGCCVYTLVYWLCFLTHSVYWHV